MWLFPSFLYNKVPEHQELVKPAKTLVERVIASAKAIVGQTEKTGNSGFVDPVFEKRMKETGWIKGQAWCAYTGELIWKNGFTTEHPLYHELEKLFSGSAVQTYNNFSKSPHFKTGKIPKAGALAVWMHGNGPLGHLGVAIEVHSDKKFEDVEGNTNTKGGREGVEVGLMPRETNYDQYQAHGLNIIGFVYLPE